MTAKNEAVEHPTRSDAEKANDEFYGLLKDMQDLLGTWTLGGALIGAGLFLIDVDLSVGMKIVAAMACIVAGLTMFISPALLFSRHWLVLKGLPPRVQVAKFARFALLIVVAVAVGTTTFHVMNKALLKEVASCVTS
jgi:hypothetical protein